MSPNEAQAKAAADVAIERFGRIDVLVNNAGFGLLGAVEEATAEEVEKRLPDQRVRPADRDARGLPAMRQARSGRILNISSIGGYRGAAGFGVYCSTKFAVEGLSEALARRARPARHPRHGVEPGFFRTDFLDASSLSVSARPIADYAGTAGAVRTRAANLNQPSRAIPTSWPT